MSAFARQTLDYGGTYAAAAAGDQRAFMLECEVHAFLSLFGAHEAALSRLTMGTLVLPRAIWEIASIADRCPPRLIGRSLSAVRRHRRRRPQAGLPAPWRWHSR